MEEKLMMAVTAHPELYDCSCPLYRDKNKKDQAWGSVSEVCGIPDLSGDELTQLYNSPVHEAERMVRPKGSSSTSVGDYSHSGVRVTLDDGSQWLVHKGKKYGDSSKTVVTPARQMSSAWEVDTVRDFQGEKTVGDFVAVGGSTYNLLRDNCHHASRRMMNQ